MGLFATEPFKKGDRVANYTGDIVVSHDKNFGDDYTLQIKKKPPTFISARRTNTGAGRYCNARLPVDGKYINGRNNASLTYDAKNKTANVTAVVNIPAGREITVPYGPEYWNAVRKRQNELQAEKEAKIKKKPSTEIMELRAELIRQARLRDAR